MPRSYQVTPKGSSGGGGRQELSQSDQPVDSWIESQPGHQPEDYHDDSDVGFRVDDGATPTWTSRQWKSGCCSTTARISSRSAPACRTGCAGICWSSAPSSKRNSHAGRYRTCASSIASNRRLRRIGSRARARVAREEVQHIRSLARQADALEHELLELIRAYRPRLLAEQGCGTLTAALLIGRTAGAQRFRSDACFGRQSGTAPIPCSSGQRTKHRLDRGGDRQLNRALHTIAITRAQHDPATKEYLARKQAEGKTNKGALRCLKRYLARRFWRLLTEPPVEPEQATPAEHAAEPAEPEQTTIRQRAAP